MDVPARRNNTNARTTRMMVIMVVPPLAWRLHRAGGWIRRSLRLAGA
jgi:hypothetical protein